METSYLLILTIGLCLSYIVLWFVFTLFFTGSVPIMKPRSVYSLLMIAALSVASYTISFSLLDGELGNRVLHALGGGFASYAVCFFVVRDAGIVIGKVRFAFFSALIATAMGVGNEILEYVLQAHFHLLFSSVLADTWLDLISNTAGLLLGVIVFTPFLPTTKHR